MGIGADKLKNSYGGTKIKEEMGSLENSHLIAPIFFQWQCDERGGIVLKYGQVLKQMMKGREKKQELDQEFVKDCFYDSCEGTTPHKGENLNTKTY